MRISAEDNILIKVPNWLGDIVLCLPALTAIRRSFPHNTVAVVGNEAARDVLCLSGLGAEFVFFDRHRKSSTALGSPGCVVRSEGGSDDTNGLRGTWLEALGALRGRSWHMAVTFAESFSSALFLRLAGAKKVLGFSADWRRILLSRALPRERLGSRPHLTREFMSLAVELGASPGDEHVVLNVTETLRDRARGLMRDAGVALSKPVIGVCPGAAYGPSKRWPPERFAAAAKVLSERGSVAIFGAPSEVEVARSIAGEVPGAVSLAGGTTPAGLAACLAECAVVIANDSGAAHLAAGVSTPVVAIFGSTDASWTRPLGKNVAVVLTEEMPCAPCFGAECDRGYACLTGISEEQVVDAAIAVSDGGLG